MSTKLLRVAAIATGAAVLLSGCGFSPYKLPLPGGADLGSDPYTVKVQFRDVLDLVPQSAVRVNDLAVGKVTDIKLSGWTAIVTVKINGDIKLPDNAEATIRQTSLLGEKFVSLAPPSTGAAGKLGNGDMIPLERAGRNPEIEEVLGAASLLFNGGGLEKTNTIVRELNNALGGKEPEIKELIQSTTSFISQLDDNKDALLTSLEKVNRLAVATNDQKDAITGALDDLPAALRVVNDQRDDLVKLLESLSRLSDVATGVIRDSKADTVANLRALVPTLTNLTKAGDDLAFATKALLTYPFSDGFLANTYAKASGRCEDGDPGAKEGACFGDFANLSVSLNIGAEQLQNILDGYLPEAGAEVPGGSADAPASPADELVDLVAGLVPASGAPELPGVTPSKTAATPSPTSTSATTKPGGICSLLGTCRTAVASSADDDLARLLVEPVVAP
ncbi:hypothetical protein C6I20_01335 [Aeromicrobium sp. A1-2]|uniref:MCE family protein n=1 Tax=Aeromicrobium sp. A1-2 TaxID=2107713 RepID=UPI000E480069|nr:MCE family protein [Aeromicrobium sp. A1-2]AXT83964.1 hypothetical protein C6I20_01335 [Aeromicrobium sp. A1-2]